MRYLNLWRNVDNWEDYLLDKFRIRPMEPLVFRCRNGVITEVPHRLLHTFKEIFFEECYSRGLPPLGAAPLCILDVGANVGYFSLFILARHPTARVIAFEPMPANFRLLQRHRDLNSGRDFAVVQKAVSGRSGELVLRYDGRDAFTTSASAHQARTGTDEFRAASTILPDILREWQLERVDLLKLDCEGAEYDILYHCPADCLAKMERISLETHPGTSASENQSALGRYLASCGYQIRSQEAMIWAWRS